MSLVGLFLPLFCVVDMETSKALMPAARMLMMPNRLLIVPGVEHTVQIIGSICACRGSMVLQRFVSQRVYGAAKESHNDRTRNTLKTPPVHISGVRHLKARFLV